MSPIQQMLLGAGAVATKTYVDDIFSTYVYTGTNSQRTLNVGIDFATKGGATFIKNRTDSDAGDARWCVFDTVRGNGYLLHTNNNDAQSQSLARQNNFSTTGFTVGAENETNGNNDEMASFNFRKAKGFFDVVTWTGDGSSNRQISHSLSSIPGLILVKKTSGTDNWNVYHRSAHATSPEDYRLFLNTTAAASTNDAVWNETKPTSSNFTVGSNDQVNGNGKSYVAYVFAGGESTAATATSCNFLGTSANADNNKINVGTTTGTKTADLVYGTGDFTIEAWIKCE